MKNFKESISLVLWSIKLGFQTSPTFYTFLILSNILNVIIPVINTFILAVIINVLIHTLSIHSTIFPTEIIYLIVLAIILRVLLNISITLNYYFVTRVSYAWEIIQISKLLEKLSSLDLEHRENPEVNLLATKMKEHVNTSIRTNTTDTIPKMISQIGGLIVIGWIFLVLNPILILLLLIPVIMHFLINKKYGKGLYIIWASKGEAKIHSIKAREALQDVNVYKESKIYNIFEYVVNKYKKVNEDFQETAIHKLKSRTKFFSISYIIEGIIFGGIQIWIITRVIGGYISVGLYSFYILNLNTVITTIELLANNVSSLVISMNYIGDYKEFLDIPNKIEISKNPIVIKNEIPEIEFINVSFKYPKNQNLVLNNISFKINKGETLAIIGRNGVGKSTIIKLIARFYDVTSGTILINGVNIKEIDLKSYYKLWGVLFQEYYLFWFSIRENISLSSINDMNNLDLIKKSAKNADVNKDIEKLNNKYETLMDSDFEKGSNLSGGQKQKIAIARALFRNPKFIVLDEPTSSLDSLSDDKIFKNIYKITKDTTTIIVSHRFSTVKNADKILVIDKGKIIEQGTHHELMLNKNHYYKMYNAQSKHFNK